MMHLCMANNPFEMSVGLTIHLRVPHNHMKQKLPSTEKKE
jgi:hypothetical protein